MKQVVKFKSDSKHYDADACIVWCFDNRFGRLLEETKRKLNLKYTDDVEVAGGAMGLTGRGSAWKDKSNYIADQVEKSIRLHHTPLVVLMVHKDCGAYKTLGLPFKSVSETQLLKDDLNEAKKELEQYLAKKEYRPVIKTYIADFDGLWEV
jgi:hypothetical protein